MSAQAERQPILMAGVSGLVVFLALQAFLAVTWKSFFAWASVTQAWWLNSDRSVVFTLAVTFLATVAVLATKRVALVSGSVAMMAGLAVGMTLTLLVVGPGNLWPIVLVLGCVLLSVAVLLGAVTAWGLRRLMRKREV